MKTNMIIAVAAMFSLTGTFTANAQTKAKQQTTAQTHSTLPLQGERGGGLFSPEQVDQRAMFPGGQEGMMSYMMQNMKYPKEPSSSTSSWKPMAAYPLPTFPTA